MRTPHHRMRSNGFIEELTTNAANSTQVWGNRQPIKYLLTNTLAQKKDQWQRTERDVYTGFATSTKLDRKKDYRVWLEDDDENDEGQARILDNLRIVYDLGSNFVMSVGQL